MRRLKQIIVELRDEEVIKRRLKAEYEEEIREAKESSKSDGKRLGIRKKKEPKKEELKEPDDLVLSLNPLLQLRLKSMARIPKASLEDATSKTSPKRIFVDDTLVVTTNPLLAEMAKSPARRNRLLRIISTISPSDTPFADPVGSRTPRGGLAGRIRRAPSVE